MTRFILLMAVALNCVAIPARSQSLSSAPTYRPLSSPSARANPIHHVNDGIGPRFAQTPPNSGNFARPPLPTNQVGPRNQHRGPGTTPPIPNYPSTGWSTPNGNPNYGNGPQHLSATPGLPAPTVAGQRFTRAAGPGVGVNLSTANVSVEGTEKLNPGRLLEPAQVIAIVGDQTVLAGDLEGTISQIREENADKVSDEQFNEQRPQIMKQLLRQRIDTVLVFNDFLRTIPVERHGEIMANIDDQFDATQMERTLQKNEVDSHAELEAKLRRNGSSVKKLKRNFAQQVIAQQMIQQNVDRNEEVTHEEMLVYYQDDIQEYEFPAKARWEQLTTEFRHFRSETAARRELAAMGNEVLRGAPLSAVAQRSRQGPRWESGGLHEWTPRGSLRSTPLDEAIFTLPMGKLSRMIRDEDGLHIIRVVERTDAGRVPFTEAQGGIKNKIQKERTREQLEDYVAKLREQTPVWTIFDENSDRLSSDTTSNTARPR